MSRSQGHLAEDERERLDECAKEPIRTPGAVQPHGVLIVVDGATLVIVQTSDNCREILGQGVEDLLGT